MKMKHLLASSSTLEGIETLITRFFCGDRKTLTESSNGVWIICRAAGTPLDGMQVRRAGKRYRFEMA